jgi:hypothetical protein
MCKVCRYTFTPCEDEGPFFLAEGEGVAPPPPPRAPSLVFTHPETRPSRGAYYYAPSGSGPQGSVLVEEALAEIPPG